MNFLDIFAGIGGFRLGMERAGHKCVGFCEIDKFARSSYKAMHNTENEIEYHDIKEVTNEEFRKLRGKVDVICGGFPCQAFSIAGKQLGFEDTRGTLFYEIARATQEIKPRYLLLENVRNLLSHDKGQTFTRILKILDELGYDVEWQVLNSKNFGVPWKDDDETIHEVQIDRFPMYACDSPLVINEVEEVRSVSIFPYFCTYETARKFIEEFGGEIEEVFC